jgi:beta-glucanase (GH16 family)
MKIENNLRYIFLALVLFTPCFVNAQVTRKLLWSDEFNYNGLPDTTKWNFEVGKAKYNNEPQFFTKDPENVVCANGKLTITCRIKEVGGTKEYTSARMNTEGKFEVKHGRIEARAKLPEGRGVWPAFWMLGTNGDWPQCGEIDIMEYWGHDPNTIASNVHTGDYNHTKGTGRGGTTTFVDPWKDYHIYAVDWYADHLDFFFDDKMFYSCKSKGEGIGEWPFNAPEYIILNFALWNNWNGKPGIDDTIFPQEFSVDYVRVYELPENSKQ